MKNRGWELRRLTADARHDLPPLRSVVFVLVHEKKITALENENENENENEWDACGVGEGWEVWEVWRRQQQLALLRRKNRDRRQFPGRRRK
jgi:hypothetical protein